MFGMKSNRKVVIVTTKSELANAIKQKEPCIEIKGELAQKMKWLGKIKPSEKNALACTLQKNEALIATATAVPSLSSKIGLDAEIALAILACGLSAVLIIGIIKGYDIEVIHGGSTIKITAK